MGERLRGEQLGDCPLICRVIIFDNITIIVFVVAEG